VPLAGFADDAHARLAAPTDDELIGVLRARRQQTCLSTVCPGCHRPGSARVVLAVIGLALLAVGFGVHPGRAEAPTAISASVFVAGNSYVMTHISYVNYPVDQVHPDLAKVTVLLALSVDRAPPGARRDNTVRGRTLHPGLLPRMRHHGDHRSRRRGFRTWRDGDR